MNYARERKARQDFGTTGTKTHFGIESMQYRVQAILFSRR